MRKRAWILIPVLLVLTGCAARTLPVPEATLVPGTDPTLPDAAVEETVRVTEERTLWFRFLDEPYLAPETRAVAQQSGQSEEMAVLSALFAGPGTQYVELGSPFPEGTRVLSTYRSGRTLLVTVSREWLNPFPDEPEDWQYDPVWQTEVPLRRKLAMQSLVATVTDSFDVDEVVVLLEQGEVLSASLRLPQSWFMDGGGDEPADAQTRDDACLLTPSVTADAIMTCWLRRDWQRLYRYVAAVDPYTGEARPAYRDFVADMENCAPLTSASCLGWSVSRDGGSCTVSLRVELRGDDGGARTLDARVIRLHRSGGVWKISMQSLTGWLEE